MVYTTGSMWHLLNHIEANPHVLMLEQSCNIYINIYIYIYIINDTFNYYIYIYYIYITYISLSNSLWSNLLKKNSYHNNFLFSSRRGEYMFKKKIGKYK